MERRWPKHPYITPRDRFTILDYPGLFYCSGYSTETNDEFIVAIDYCDRFEMYRLGARQKWQSDQYRKYILYKISYEVVLSLSYRLSGEKLGVYLSADELKRAIKNQFPGYRMTVRPKDAPWEDEAPPCADPPAAAGSESNGCMGCLIFAVLAGLYILFSVLSEVL